jgi:hypothetical protein
MLELGKAGAHGYPKGELPVVRDGGVVAVLRASSGKEAATADVGDREWLFAKRTGELPLHQQVFQLWLELVISRRNTAAVGARATAAVIGGTS